MGYCIVENGMIVNIIVAEEAVAEEIGALPSYEGAAIGERYNPPPDPVPDPSAEADLEALAVDHEFRITLLELGVI